MKGGIFVILKSGFRLRPSFYIIVVLMLSMLLFIILNSAFKSLIYSLNDNIPIAELNEGWEYKWQPSNLRDENVISEISEIMQDEDWQSYNLLGERVKTTKDLHTAWFRIKLPEHSSWINPTLYFDAVLADDIIVFHDSNFIYRLNHGEPKIIQNPFAAIHRFIVPIGSCNSDSSIMIKMTSHSGFIGPRTVIKLSSNEKAVKLLYERELDNILIGFFLLVFGIFLLPILMFLKKSNFRVFLFLNLFMIFLGLWMLTNTVNFNLLILNASIQRIYINTFAKYALVTMMILFVWQMLNIKSSIVKALFRICISLNLLLLVLFIVSLLFNENYVLIIDSIWYLLVAVSFMILVITVISSAIKGDRDSRVFASGFTFFMLICIYEAANYALHSIIPTYYKWGLLIFIISLVLILGRRFAEAHEKLYSYSVELEEKNEYIVNKNREIERLNQTLEEKIEERTFELHEAMDKLVMAQQHLISSEKLAAVGSLVAGVSHEISTPIGVGVTAVSHLEGEVKAVEEKYLEKHMKRHDFESFLSSSKELTDVISLNLKKAAALIHSFKRVAVDQAREEKQGFNVIEYIEEILIALSPELKKGSYKIAINCAEDMGITSYPGALSQILTNLIMNSLIHGFKDKREGDIEINVEKEGELLELDYKDNGCGISSECIGKIFEPFYTTGKDKGYTGLGLNVVYNLVTSKLNGSINCESELGKGVRFIISFNL